MSYPKQRIEYKKLLFKTWAEFKVFSIDNDVQYCEITIVVPISHAEYVSNYSYLMFDSTGSRFVNYLNKKIIKV